MPTDSSGHRPDDHPVAESLPKLERELLPTFYARQDVQNVDLNQLFIYDDAAFRAHNRAFHGCGIVCGLEVRLTEDKKYAVVSPGYALSPQGDEIYVPEAVSVPVDCAQLIEVDCYDLDGAGVDAGEDLFEPAYIVLRPTTRMGRERPLAPARCADRECAPTRVCAGFEVACATSRPEACPPRFDLSCRSVEQIIHGALLAGDLGDTKLFGCAHDTGETGITLARVDFAVDEATKRIVPSLSFAERAYIPSIRFLFDLARRIGAEMLPDDIPVEEIPALNEIWTVANQAIIDRLKQVGYETVASIANEEPEILKSRYNPGPLFTLQSAEALVNSARILLRDRAGHARREL